MLRTRIVALAMLLLLLASPVTASDYGPYFGYVHTHGWSAGTDIPRGYRGGSCGGYYRVTLFRDANYQGMHTEVCRDEPSLCKVPMEAYSNLNFGTCHGFATDHFNDWASSIRIEYLRAGYCIFIYEDGDYSRSKRYRHLNASDSNLGTFSDIMSSIEVYRSVSGTCA